MKKIIHKPEEYTISVRLEHDEGEWIYVARVEEIPDIKEFSETAEFARELALDSIATAQKMCIEGEIPFPPPKVPTDTLVSGRVTLRLPRSVHARCIQEAGKESVSLNTYLVSKISDFSASTNNSDIHSLLIGISADLSDIKMKSAFALKG